MTTVRASIKIWCHSFKLAGTIDSDYRGEVSVLLINQGNKTFFFERGDRIAQMVFTKVEQVKFQEVEALDTSDRGLGGYGSTGLSKNSESSML